MNKSYILTISKPLATYWLSVTTCIWIRSLEFHHHLLLLLFCSMHFNLFCCPSNWLLIMMQIHSTKQQTTTTTKSNKMNKFFTLLFNYWFSVFIVVMRCSNTLLSLLLTLGKNFCIFYQPFFFFLSSSCRLSYTLCAKQLE